MSDHLTAAHDAIIVEIRALDTRIAADTDRRDSLMDVAEQLGRLLAGGPDPAPPAAPKPLPPVVAPSGQIQCPECDLWFKNATGLGIHRSRLHGKAGETDAARQAKSKNAKRVKPTPVIVDCPNACGWTGKPAGVWWHTNKSCKNRPLNVIAASAETALVKLGAVDTPIVPLHAVPPAIVALMDAEDASIAAETSRPAAGPRTDADDMAIIDRPAVRDDTVTLGYRCDDCDYITTGNGMVGHVFSEHGRATRRCEREADELHPDELGRLAAVDA